MLACILECAAGCRTRAIAMLPHQKRSVVLLVTNVVIVCYAKESAGTMKDAACCLVENVTGLTPLMNQAFQTRLA